jgi:hypothetical protein
VKEAIRFVREEYSIAQASLLIKNVKRNVVPHMMLSDWPAEGTEEAPGARHERHCAIKEALVESLIMCLEFQYPMNKNKCALVQYDIRLW